MNSTHEIEAILQVRAIVNVQATGVDDAYVALKEVPIGEWELDDEYRVTRIESIIMLNDAEMDEADRLDDIAKGIAREELS